MTTLTDEERAAKGKFVTAILNAFRDIITEGDEYLNVLGKPILETPTKAEKPTEPHFNGLGWTLKKGTKGNYDQVENDGSPEFKALTDYLAANKGFSYLYGFKCWIHNNDPNLIDRKR